MSDVTPDGMDIRSTHRTLTGDAATTHAALQEAACRVENINSALTAAQAEFRKALAAHMAAITGAKVEP